MLDSETKRRIDSCRDILVGKVPDPKSQVEQITIALIYKFMDDMDAEAEELGGKRSFFAGKYAKYGWAKLMSPSMGGFDVLALYSEAIAKMNENPGIPALFRDIFKNAYLPYRDPETLRSFLKEINVFTYDHSERLGDAFEYLLSVLGSQGDAGQFRTPRHIIDFMVEIINPQKNESILDPACGTAGFLISAWKHILKHNTTLPSPSGRGARGEGASVRAGDLLTPEQRKHLAANIHGYDISPDMVRLSLVNLYLHGFTDPHIVEYDTLTSEDKWNETADVILANPPFMSPKGGIKPHKRFSIQAKRSEVLFVDYMAEHLSPQGRAAIIVPEGIIFQSQTAYSQLRKMLIENSLVAVISLPAGCFNPYSGVKTSILILDKSLAKKAKTIAFFKVENDGFGLGAQRRAIEKNDLPQVQAELAVYLQALRSGQQLEPSGETTSHSTTPQKARQVAGYPPGGGQGGGLQLSCGLIVSKDKIAANGDYNLSGERYREGNVRASYFPIVPLGDVCELLGGSTPSKQNESYWTNGTVKWISSKHIDDRGNIKGYELISQSALEESSTRVAPKNSTIIITRVSVGKFAFADDDYAVNQDLTALVSKDAEILAPEFIRVVAHHIANVVEKNAEGIGVRGVTRKFLSELPIPLPPLEVQKEIVAEIEGYQKVINGARAVLDHYRPHIPIHPDWPMVELGNKLSFVSSGATPKGGRETYLPEGVLFIRSQNILCGSHDFSDAAFISQDTHTEMSRSQVKYGDVFLNITGASIGRSAWMDLDIPANVNQHVAILRVGLELNRVFLSLFLNSDTGQQQIFSFQAGASREALNYSQIRQLKIPLPPLATQQQIVAEIEAEQALVAANRELIARFEQKIQATLARVWGEEPPIPAGA
jgi:type I restriction enzyme M protein